MRSIPKTMSLEQRDLELIEKLIFKSADDIAVSISRSFERLEERVDAAESRLYSRFADLEDKLDSTNALDVNAGSGVDDLETA